MLSLSPKFRAYSNVRDGSRSLPRFPLKPLRFGVAGGLEQRASHEDSEARSCFTLRQAFDGLGWLSPVGLERQNMAMAILA